MGKINVEAEKNELILENEFGDKVIIPAKKRQWVQKQIEKGNHADLDNYISTLPIKSDFAEEGSVVPGDPTKKVKVYTGKPEYFVQGVAPRNGERKNEDGSVSTHLMSYTSADGVHYAYPTLFQDGDKWIQLDDKDDWAAFKEAQKRKELFKFDNEEDAKKFAEGSWKTENIKEYDIDSPEYRELYNSGAIANYDKNSDTYILSKPLDEVTITAEAPQWAKDKRNLEKQYTKDWYIDNNMPKFSRSMGISANNMHPNNVKQYEEFINNKLAESILKRHPKVGTSANDRLEWYNSLSEKEREIVNNSYSADKFSPAVRAYMESQSNEAKKYGILETFRDADKLAQSVEGTPERFRIFPNAENNFENYVNPLMWIGDMAKGLGNIPKDIKKGNYLKAAGSIASPLLGGALGGLGAKTPGQFVKNIFLPLGGLEENIVKGGKNLIDATKAGSKVLGKEKGLNKIDNILQESNQLPEPPHEIILDQPSNYIETVNLERQGVKNKKIMPSFDDVDLGNDLILRNNPSRVVNKEDILGKNRSLISVKNKNNSEYIDLKSWKDNDGQIYYYMSANMPSSKIKAGKAYLELEKHIPKGASLLENSSLSYDSLLNILKQTKNPKFETFIKGRIPMNDMSVSNKLKSIGDKSSDSVDLGFYSKDIADNAVIELNELLNKYNLPEATVVKRTTSYQPQAHLPYEKKDIFEIELPNIGLKKLYSIIGLTSAGAAIQSQQQNKTEQ